MTLDDRLLTVARRGVAGARKVAEIPRQWVKTVRAQRGMQAGNKLYSPQGRDGRRHPHGRELGRGLHGRFVARESLDERPVARLTIPRNHPLPAQHQAIPRNHGANSRFGQFVTV